MLFGCYAFSEGSKQKSAIALSFKTIPMYFHVLDLAGDGVLKLNEMANFVLGPSEKTHQNYFSRYF